LVNADPDMVKNCV